MSDIFIFHFLDMQQWLVKGLEWYTMTDNCCYISGVGGNYFVWYAQLLSCIQLFVISWTVALETPLSVGSSRQEYCSGLPFSSPGSLPNPGIEFTSLVSPALAGRFFTTEPPGKPSYVWCVGQREVRFFSVLFHFFP